MARTGFHLGLGPGYAKAIKHAKELGCSTVQIFTHSPRSFSFKELNHEELTILLNGWKDCKIGPIYSHCNYLINLASSENRTYYGSVETMKKELVYAKAFGADYFVLHVGKHKEMGVETGMLQIAKAIEMLKGTIHETKVTILFETVAGAGTEIGAKFEELSQLLDMLDPDVREHIGVCIDTCHIFAAGYDIRSKEKVEKVIKEIESTFGIKRVKLIHVNDSKGELGDHLDRHEHLGKGHIGLEGLKAFLTHPKIKDIPMVLETPIDEPDDDRKNLAILNSFFT